jgi:uncharacterized protein with GYD domain
MPKFLFKGHYTAEGLAGLLKEGGSARRGAVEKAAAALGGSIDAFYFAFGDDDVFVIGDMPNNAAAAEMSMVVGASGRVHTTVVPLLSVDDVDAIASSDKPTYTPPGG